MLTFRLLRSACEWFIAPARKIRQLARGMSSFFKECGCIKPTRCPHPYKIRFRDALGKQREESGYDTQDDAIERLTAIHAEKKSTAPSVAEARRELGRKTVEGRRHEVRGGARKRAAGAGARHQLAFIDRLVATLIHLRHDLPHSVLALLFGVDRSTVPRAIGEIRGLLAERGCAGPDRPGLRLRTLADVFACARAEGIELRLDATEVQVRRLAAGRGGRRAFVSGKKKQTTMKATVIADARSRTLCADVLRPGRMRDATAARNEGTVVCFQYFPEVEVLLDDGYLGLRRDRPGQAIAPPRKPNKIALPHVRAAGEEARHNNSSKRTTVEYALADHERWKQLIRWIHRREVLPDTYRAIARLVSDRNTTTWQKHQIRTVPPQRNHVPARQRRTVSMPCGRRTAPDPCAGSGSGAGVTDPGARRVGLPGSRWCGVDPARARPPRGAPEPPPVPGRRGAPIGGSHAAR
ncbi:hypothetical protein GGE06_007902 [Streptomyces sp. SFB5A]|uniref:Transposase n=1 Tax=Streptomyces nymphaeiformis TaxID=2663842 RepID=A0A7W7XFY0_9ACTN|nr:hypothetical protein [Streptomyces nymphaeiformis]